MTSPSSPSSTTSTASTTASTTAPASTTGPASTSSGNSTRDHFISQQQGVLCEHSDYLAYYDYYAIRVPQAYEELDPSDPDALLIRTLWLPFTEDLEQLRVLQADHREALKPYFAGEYDSDAEESALLSRILEAAFEFKTFQAFYRKQMAPLLALVNKMDLNDHDRQIGGSTKIRRKKPKRVPSGGGGRARFFKHAFFLSLGILVILLISYWYYSGGDTTAPKGGSGSDGSTTNAQWITTAVDGPGGYGGSEDPTFAPNDRPYGPNDPSSGPYGRRPVPKERSLPYEEDPPAPLHRPNKDSSSRTVGLIILITLLVAVSVMILAIVAYNRLTAGGSHDFQDLESGLMNTESQKTDTNESAADIES